MRRTMRTLLGLGLAAVVALASPVASAQPEPAKPELPPPPTVDDPMLAPVARAKTEIVTWEDALKHVRARSTDLQIAVEDVTRAESQQRVALASALPSLNATGAYTRNLITKDTQLPVGINPDGSIKYAPGPPTPNVDQATGSIVASQPIFAMRAWHAIGTASVATDVTRLALDDTKRLIALAVANAIVGVVTAERICELNRVGLRNALQRLDLTTRKTNLGGGTGLDVIRARQDVETARSTLVDGDETLRQARESLGLALGLPEQVGVPPTVDISGLELAARTACKPADAIDDRPDVAALRTRAEVSHRAITDVKYQFLPTIAIQSAVATTTADTGSSPNTTWNVQAILSVPLFEGGARYGNLRDAENQELQAIQRLEAQKRKAQIEVEQSRRGVGVAEERRKVAAAARDLAAETDRLTRASYLEGRGTSLELVVAAQSLREAEIALALRDFEVVKARVLAVLALASCPW
jgi:outer membrane protein TolC